MSVAAWLIFAFAAGVIEAVTVTLVSVWFALGAVCSACAAAFGASAATQWIVFWVASLILLILTAPLCKKFRIQKTEPTNADRVIGQLGIVTEEINILQGSGEVKIDGKRWSAKSESGENIPAGATVKVAEISGVHLIVSAE